MTPSPENDGFYTLFIVLLKNTSKYIRIAFVKIESQTIKRETFHMQVASQDIRDNKEMGCDCHGKDGINLTQDTMIEKLIADTNGNDLNREE